MGSLCSRQGAEKEHSRHEKRNKSRKKKVSPANQKQISSLTSDIDLELKDLDKDFAQLEEANKKHKNNEHQVGGVLEHLIMVSLLWLIYPYSGAKEHFFRLKEIKIGEDLLWRLLKTSIWVEEDLK